MNRLRPHKPLIQSVEKVLHQHHQAVATATANNGLTFLKLVADDRSDRVTVCNVIRVTPPSGLMPFNYNKTEEETVSDSSNSACSVDLKPGDCEMVVDGGGHFSPAVYRWFTRMSLLL